MLGLAFGLASSVAWGISDFLGGLQSRRISTMSVLLVSQPVGLVLALGVALAFGGSALSVEDAALALAAGAIIVAALGAFYRGMALGSVSVVATITALGVLVPVIAGLARGEEPATIQLLGAALAIVGVVAVAREPDPESRAAGRVALGLAAVAAVGIGAFFWLVDLSSGPEPAWTVVAVRVGGVTALLAAAAWTRPSVAYPREIVPALVMVGVLDTTASSLFAVATNHGLLALVSVAGSLYPAVTVLLARVVLGERLARSRQAGVVVALAGVAMIAAGG